MSTKEQGIVAEIALTEQWKDIHIATANNDLLEVYRLLRLSPNLIYALTTNDETPLHIAATYGTKLTAEILISNGAYDVINQRDKDGYTPLHTAVFNNSSEVVSVLIAAKADINKREYNNGWTPLHAAVEAGKPHIVYQLIKANANINQLDYNKRTPLYLALELCELSQDQREYMDRYDIVVKLEQANNILIHCQSLKSTKENIDLSVRTLQESKPYHPEKFTLPHNRLRGG
jgi:uncharacterized protein